MRRLLIGLALVGALAAPSADAGSRAAPGREVSATSPRVMVAAANPLAVEAGVKVLRAGGSAVDAAVAVQAVLGLVEPQSSGLGGGAFMVYYDARTKRVTGYDGRETAPAGATPDMFLGPEGRPLPFGEAVTSGRSTGVPGAIAMLALAQKEHGKKRWSDLFDDALTLSRDGFVVSPRLANYVSGPVKAPDVATYFTKPDGQRYKAGDILKNPAYAATIGRLAREGTDALYKGEIAADIAARIHQEPRPGSMTVADLAAYRPKAAEALCRPYKVYVVCVPAPPSGGVGLLELLGILENTDIAAHGPGDPQGWFLFAEASRLMYADRDFYVGDPTFVNVPVKGLIDPAYTASRAKQIGTTALPGAPAPGKPVGAVALAPDATREPGGTSSFAVADADGNVLVITTTVESTFGSGRMTHGFFLNNQLTDFSFSPTVPGGGASANAVAAGKRPRSTMSPAVVLDGQGRFVAGVGSPGGPAILAYVGKTLVGVLDWKLSMPEAIALPNLIARGESVTPETGFDDAVLGALRAKGMVVRGGAPEGSGLHGIVARPGGGYLGAADPRREGIAKGF